MNTITEYYAVLDDKGNVINLVNFSGEATAENYVNLAKEDYDKILGFIDGGLGVNIADDGTINTYNPPPIPLTALAQSGLSDVQSQAPMMVTMGETFGPKTKAYVQALQAIINGTDTASTDLPQVPENLTD